MPDVYEVHTLTLYGSVCVTLGHAGAGTCRRRVLGQVVGDYATAARDEAYRLWREFIVSEHDTNMRDRETVHNQTVLYKMSVHIPLFVPSKYLVSGQPYEVTRQDVSEFVQGTVIETRVGVLRVGDPWNLGCNLALLDEPVKADGAKLIEDSVGAVTITRDLSFEVRPNEYLGVDMTFRTAEVRSGIQRPLRAIIALQGVEYRKVR